MRQSVRAARRALGVAGVLAAAGFAHVSFAQDVPSQATPPEAPPADQSQPSSDVPATCTKIEFESAVDHAAEALRDLNNKNRPEFQGKLRKLKEKRAWNDNQFLKEAAPYVKDDQISVYDAKTNELLASISTMGQQGANAQQPDCAMLSELRGLMSVLIETQGSKWSYMFKKLDDELAK